MHPNDAIVVGWWLPMNDPLVNFFRGQYKRLLPVPSLSLGRYLVNSWFDLLSLFGSAKNELLPPSRWLFDGSQSVEEFRRDGEEFFGYFVDIAGLQPSHRIIEIGSGIGRMAIPLTRYMEEEGSYDGFDVVKLGVEWCRNNITPRHKNFNFHHVDIYNGLYNPRGRLDAAQYVLPFSASSVDRVFATSVFTHTLPEVFENYIKETARILVPGGRALASMFLLNEEADALIASGRAWPEFRHDQGRFRTESDRVLEGAVGLPETYVRTVFQQNELGVVEPIRYGSWCGRDRYLSIQDIVVVTKRPQECERK